MNRPAKGRRPKFGEASLDKSGLENQVLKNNAAALLCSNQTRGGSKHNALPEEAAQFAGKTRQYRPAALNSVIVC
jgi:hypothetical protein